MRLTSWEQKGMLWGESAELTGLINCIKGMKDKNIKLVNVIQVMLIRLILSCQRRAFNLWEFVPAKHRTLQRLYDMTHKGAWKVLFKASKVPPPHIRGPRTSCHAAPQSGEFSDYNRIRFFSIYSWGSLK